MPPHLKESMKIIRISNGQDIYGHRITTLNYKQTGTT